MIGEKVSFEAVPKNVGSEVTSGGRLIADSGKPCSSEDLMTTTVDGGGWSRRRAGCIVGKISWRQTMHASVNEHTRLEIDAFAAY